MFFEDTAKDTYVRNDIWKLMEKHLGCELNSLYGEAPVNGGGSVVELTTESGDIFKILVRQI